MGKLSRNFRLWPIVLAFVIAPIFIAFFEGAGVILIDFFVERGLCQSGDNGCILLYYLGLISIPIILAITYDLINKSFRDKKKKKFRDLIKEGQDLYMASTRSSEYKNKRREWKELLNDWDINKMQPFIEENFGKDELAIYISPVRELVDTTLDNDELYRDLRSILSTRLQRANLLLLKVS